MDLGLQQDLAVVVGGANGIGLAIASRFAAEGASPLLVDLDSSSDERARELAERHGVECWGRQADATDYAVMQAVADEAAKFGRKRTHLVVAAGCGSGKFGFPFWNLEPDDWTRVLNVNLLSAVNAAHAFVPTFTSQRKGSVAFIVSIAGQIGSQTDPPYSAAKAGLINFMQCAAKDLAPYDVRVNAVSPGMIKTALNQSVWKAWYDRQPEGERQEYDAWGQEKVQRITPLARWQDPDDIAAATVFLASDHARNITGQTLNVDGGQVMHS